VRYAWYYPILQILTTFADDVSVCGGAVRSGRHFAMGSGGHRIAEGGHHEPSCPLRSQFLHFIGVPSQPLFHVMITSSKFPHKIEKDLSHIDFRPEI
jgi:hypothetical protein